jgi:hypothetical protein
MDNTTDQVRLDIDAEFKELRIFAYKVNQSLIAFSMGGGAIPPQMAVNNYTRAVFLATMLQRIKINQRTTRYDEIIDVICSNIYRLKNAYGGKK